MTLKFFFNRKGLVVYGLTLAGWAGNLSHLWALKSQWGERGAVTGVSFIVYVFLSFFITLTRFFPWYPRAYRGFGIESHFEKTLVPLAYVMVVTNVVHALWGSCAPFLIFVDCLLVGIVSVNFNMLYFHFRDHDPMPPSYFAENLHLKETP